jgi:hypothetical protein
MTEKLTMEDAFVMELIVNKINEVIDRLDEMEDDYDRRISAHWKFHRKDQEEKAGTQGVRPQPKGKRAEWKKEKEPLREPPATEFKMLEIAEKPYEKDNNKGK